ncbi:hypothetical protein COLO4_16643 [Corchorus olitorius]|uniref:Helitron helicase-like domain-containing protein n=1 Tax=Corchorus olitorius TaxID=93759 RepID=A0A1R3JG90_9ROSI|nr:hypothetical protein COLO4_16643 [Corchorus olitorius]
MTSSNGQFGLDSNVVEGLIKMLDKHNPLVKVFRMARDRFKEGDFHNIKIRLISRHQDGGSQYNMPTASEVAALIVNEGNNPSMDRNIIVEQHEGGLKRITELHPSFMAMQYPILFPYGEDFYWPDIILQQRRGEGDTLLRGGRLFQQFIADGFTTLDDERIGYILRNQHLWRSEVLNGLKDAICRGDTTAAALGRRFLLPSSHTDLIPGQSPEDRPDIIISSFQDKVG